MTFRKIKERDVWIADFQHDDKRYRLIIELIANYDLFLARVVVPLLSWDSPLKVIRDFGLYTTIQGAEKCLTAYVRKMLRSA